MNCREVKEHLVDHAPGVRECPFCREHLSSCPECAAEAEFLAGMFEGAKALQAKSRHPKGDEFAGRLKAVCRSREPFARAEWARRTLAVRAAVAAVVALALLASLLMFTPDRSTDEPADMSLTASSLEDMAEALSTTYNTEFLISPTAKRQVWTRTASVYLDNRDVMGAATAVARAFGLEVLEWDGKYVFEDRAMALLYKTGPNEQVVKHLSIDMQFDVALDEMDELDCLANQFVAVDDLEFNTPVSKHAKLPFIKTDSDVTVLKRPGETFEVRRSLPWLMVDKETGKLEFIAVTENDLERFEPIRKLVRSGEGDKDIIHTLGEYPEAFRTSASVEGVKTLGELVSRIAALPGTDIVVGSGGSPGAQVSGLSGSVPVAEALDRVCRNRAFYFTWLEDEQMFILDERSRLQQYLHVCAMRVPSDTKPETYELYVAGKIPSTSLPRTTVPAFSAPPSGTTSSCAITFIRCFVWCSPNFPIPHSVRILLSPDCISPSGRPDFGRPSVYIL
ncbi:MAG: hypothetical protein U5N86_06095 [Planctomycetota bacterium]|nr:hypothetical protein [Planctomycetota bacterium]